MNRNIPLRPALAAAFVTLTGSALSGISGSTAVSAALLARRFSDITAQFGPHPSLPATAEVTASAPRHVGRRLVVHYRLVSRGRSAESARREFRGAAYRDLVHRVVAPVQKLQAQVDRLTRVLAERNALALQDTEAVTSAGTGRYVAEGDVSVDPDTFASDFCSQGASNLRLIVVLTGAGPVGQEQIQTALEGELQRSGFDVFDWQVAARHGELGTMAAQLQQAQSNPRVSFRVGARYLSSYFVSATIHGSNRAVSDEASVYTADAEVRVVRAEDGRVVLSDTFDGSGTGVSADRARAKALAALAHRIAAELPDRLREQIPETPVTLTVRDLPADRRQAVADAVQRLNGVSDVQREDSGDALVLRFRSREKPFALASALEEQSGVNVQTVVP